VLSRLPRVPLRLTSPLPRVSRGTRAHPLGRRRIADQRRRIADQAHAPGRHRRPLMGSILALAALAFLIVPTDDPVEATAESAWAPLSSAAFAPLPQPSAETISANGDAAEAAASPTAPREAPTPSTAPAVAPAPASPPPTSPASPTAPAPRPAGPVHVVRRGDNLWSIARRHRASVAAILRWNEVDPRRLAVGQRILVPAAVGRASTSGTLRSSAGGRHLWPLAVRGILTRGYSAAHPAFDIAAPTGTPVRAIAAGTVVWAGWRNNGGGYVVVVRHPDGMTSEYNHNSKVTVARGDRVDQGDTIALVGSTGNSTGPHLDIRIEMGGRLINPADVY